MTRVGLIAKRKTGVPTLGISTQALFSAMRMRNSLSGIESIVKDDGDGGDNGDDGQDDGDWLICVFCNRDC